MLQPGDLPDLLDVSDLLLRAVIDAEGVSIRRVPAACHGVTEPIWKHQVSSAQAQHVPFTTP